MTTSYATPAPDAIGRLLADLFGRRVACRRSMTRLTVTPRAPGALGTFVGDDGELAALVLSDLSLAVAMGAALSVIPPNIANEGTRNGRIPDNVLENLGEVMNVARSWFDQGPAVRLLRVDVAPFSFGRETQLLLMRPGERVDLDVDVSGYGVGKMAIFVRKGDEAGS